MSYIKQLYDFLNRLEVNNNRPWFKEHKDEYDFLRSQWTADIDRLRSLMIQWNPELQRQPLADCFYRIYRDTRFSPDKTPYKTYFSAIFSPMGKKGFYPGFYLQLGDSERFGTQSGLYGGMWCTPTPVLRKIRKAIVDNEEEFTEIISNPELNKYFPGWEGEMLKKVPQGFDKDSPLADVLRLKEYGRSHIVGKDFFLQLDWIEKTSELFRLIQPLNRFLQYSIDEEV